MNPLFLFRLNSRFPSLLKKLWLALGVASFGFNLTGLAADAPRPLLLEAEEFQLLANWDVVAEKGASGGKILRTGSSQSDAFVAIRIPVSGSYHLWVRAFDFLENDKGKRQYSLVVDDTPLPGILGNHGFKDWYWQQAGTLSMEAGVHIIALRDTSHFYPRCDSILITPSNTDPNTINLKELAKYRVPREELKVSVYSSFPQTPTVSDSHPKRAVQIETNALRLTFDEARDAAGLPTLLRTTEVYLNGQWQTAPTNPAEESLAILYSRHSGLEATRFFPSWTAGTRYEFEAGGQKYQCLGRGDPFSAGQGEILVARSIQSKTATSVTLNYDTPSGRKALVTWSLLPDRRDITIEAEMTADQAGEYSFVFSSFRSWKREEIAFNLLPPLYNFQRLPDKPLMVTSSITPQPLALAQPANSGWTFGVLANVEKMPYVWPRQNNAKVGFSLLNAKGEVQPTLFIPILGSPDSQLKAGQKLTSSWIVLATPGDWKQALEYASEKVFQVTDNRKPYSASLSDAAFNLIDLMKNDVASGWNTKLKGFYNIESPSTVSQVAPLAIVAAAVLGQDEDFYVQRALPTIEYTLSRPGPSFATSEGLSNSYVNAETVKLGISKFFGAAYWHGLHALLDQKNSWLGNYVKNEDGSVRRTGGGIVPLWSDLLARYKSNPDPVLLEKIKAQCNDFLKSELYSRKIENLGLAPFYNISFYPYWWDLIDLYEITGDRHLIDAAEESACHTIAGQASFPKPPDGDIPAPAFGVNDANEITTWWKDDKRFRLGFPLTKDRIPEKTVPAQLVSRVGLGLEQPSTYFGKGIMNNILMSCWAPHLLRLYQITGRDIYQTYARNAVVGRYANYPGYYTRRFSDLPEGPKYPYEGPDITNLYFHHIPEHYAFTIDFLVAEASIRSQGQIQFPYVKQEGYVWFNNRVYGHGEGKVLGEEKMHLWLNKNLVQVSPVEVNYLTARNKNRFALILMNESDKPIAPKVTLNSTLIGIDPQSNVSVEVPAKGVRVVSFPILSPKELPTIPQLNSPPIHQPLTGPWGTLHAYRIRSPFGKDSLYIYATGRPGKGSTARLVLETENIERSVAEFPYEFSLYPIPMEKEVRFHLQLRTPDGTEIRSQSYTLPGT